LDHLLADASSGASAAFRLTLSEPAASYVELRDSAGRHVAGSTTPSVDLYDQRAFVEQAEAGPCARLPVGLRRC
jgi:hypothetical protein